MTGTGDRGGRAPAAPQPDAAHAGAPQPVAAPSHAGLDFCGERLWLLPELAAWWPARRLLLVADVHAGKAASYRMLGQPVPHGTTRDNLQRLDALLARFAPAGLILLGDFLHGPALRAATGPTLAALRDWRAGHAGLAVTLVRGNHDRRLADLAARIGIGTVEEPLCLGGLALRHHPRPVPAHGVLAGHSHPVHRLHGPGRDSVRLPCFVVDEAVLTLPAFGAFTGGHDVDPAPGRRIYVAGAGRVWPVR
ncbi:ligase-associated DNA damage response endonuclease PdeM [Pigmentiphaga soli]|uniref:Ligase-associated DNA damage response endonuclease PdeM n=1 Tax=Pigmentiphaga soli TaxID=1007095 RepID=A0ABP8GC23_9BURK